MLWKRSATSLRDALRRRELSAVEVMEAHLDRIAAVNPALSAIVTLLPRERLLDRARAADATAGPRGPLHGLPVAHKDVFLTRGTRTTFGSPIFRDFVPDEDSLVVERLRAAGAIMVGKTNTPEFAAGSQTFNPVFGPTRNPWDLSRTCGGSSGGAAAALASGMVPIADGTDYGGSLRNPASFCGVVGLRPTPGRVPDVPDPAPWFPVAVPGPMARTVRDAALLLSAMAGPDPRAPLSLPEPGSGFDRPLDRDFGGIRVAWAPDFAGLPFDPAVLAALEPARKALEEIGCAVEEASPDMRDAGLVFRRYRAFWFDLRFGPLLERHRPQIKETVVEEIEAGKRLTAPDLADASRHWARILDRLARFQTDFSYLALPACQVPPFPVETPWPTEIAGVKMRSYTDWMGSCAFVSILGVPALSLPAGFAGDLPVGLQIVGRRGDDLGVLQLGAALEARLGASRTPVTPKGGR